MDPYLPGFPGGTVSKLDYDDLRTLRGAYGTTNLQRYPGAKPCNAFYVYSSSLYCNPLVNWQPVQLHQGTGHRAMISQPLLSCNTCS